MSSVLGALLSCFSRKPKVPSVLDHITDVGAGQFEGIDSTYRIRQQYQAANVQNPCIFPAGHSPLHVAFAGTTCLAPKAVENADWILKTIFGINQKKRLPIALNSAPRTSDKPQDNGKEDNIYWVQGKDHYADFLVYGLQVVEWVHVFYPVAAISKVISVQEIIEDTSHGSQFRSAEHLPLVHVLAAMGVLEEHASIETVPMDCLTDRFPHNNIAIIAPCDEYGNGRLIVEKEMMKKILEAQQCTIAGLIDFPLQIKTSLTQVIPGEVSVWPSSNYFPNRNLGVLNIGTRWAEGTTGPTDRGVKDIAKHLNSLVGKTFTVDI